MNGWVSFELFARKQLVEQVRSEFSTEGIFTIKLHRPPDTVEKTVAKTVVKTSEKTSEKILELIRENPHITIDELSGSMGKSTRSIEMQLGKLRESNNIRRAKIF